MYFQKNGNSEGEGGVHDCGILRAWGGNTFWNFRRQGGDKTWKPSVVGYGYFLKLPICQDRKSTCLDGGHFWVPLHTLQEKIHKNYYRRNFFQL